MVFNVEKIVDFELEQPFSSPSTEGIENILGFITDKIKSDNIGVVQGPPGTRKTFSIFTSIEKVFDNLDENELIIYVAPTNALVAQGLQYAVRALRWKGFTQREVKSEILRSVRVYGSQFELPGTYKKLRDKVDAETRIVLTTPYQIPSIEEKDFFHIMVDEASRMKLHEAFMEIRRKIVEKISNGEGLEGSMIVVGDPMQAIVLPEHYREIEKLRKERLLLESLLEGLLTISGVDTRELESSDLTREALQRIRGKWFEFIEVTFRLPQPTERPISMGFYDGKLTAKFSFEERLKELEISPGNSPLKFGDETLDKLSESVFECLSTHIPLLVIEPTESDWMDEEYGILNEPHRAKIAGALSVVLSSYGFRTTVVTAYKDQAFHIKMFTEEKYRNYLNNIKERVDFINVHRILGGENQAIVAVLGKEYATRHEDRQTVYFQEPELLNVQLSRHKAFLAIVGDLRRLYRSATSLDQRERTKRYRPIIETAREILELTNVEENEIERAKRGREKYEGDEGLYIRWKI
ncbi:MAG: AAA domain-containing protein [Sulfolobales archaeon]